MLSPSSAASKIRELEASIRGLSRRGAEDRSASPEAKKKLKRGRALLDEARAKYAKASAASSSSSAKGKSRTAEKGDDTLALLSTFQTKMRGEREEGREGKRRREGKSKSKSKEVEVGEEIPPEAREYGAGESDEDEDDKGWMSHRCVERFLLAPCPCHSLPHCSIRPDPIRSGCLTHLPFCAPFCALCSLQTRLWRPLHLYKRGQIRRRRLRSARSP